MAKPKLLVCAAIPLLLCAAIVPNLTGDWKLNVDKSHWGKKVRPVSETVHIDHNEPSWKYKGSVTEPNGEPRTFSYDGAIDGKERDASSPYGPGKMTFRRVNRFTISSTFKSNDGRFTETATSTSTDGRVLTRRMSLNSPDGNLSWTEVFEKQ